MTLYKFMKKVSFQKKNNKNTHYNKAYMELALEVLEFVEKELEYGN